MVLIAIVGELGVGKTLTLTYLSWNNWFYKKRKIYANYNLYGIPFTPVKSLEALKKMIPSETPTLDQLLSQNEIFFAGDELWRWIDSRCALFDISEKERRNIKNKIITDILAASRKAFVTIAYTTQTISQVDKRIREVTDFTVYPVVKGDICTALFFVGTRSTSTAIDKEIRFFTEPFYAAYNTFERVSPLEEYGCEEETYLPVEKNPAWMWYLINKRKLSEEKAVEESRKMEKLLKNG
jgi:hypothetical protein